MQRQLLLQKPSNIIAYYQQIGRAGRAIDKAYAILFCGYEDDEINNYFIDSAFPTEAIMNEVIQLLLKQQGLKIADFEKNINMKPSKINECIKYLQVNGVIYKENNKYYKTPKIWQPDLEKSEKITEMRKNELIQMNDFVKTSNCYMKYIADALDDPLAKPGGKCANCLNSNIFETKESIKDIRAAQIFIKNDFNIIEPRKKWPIGVRILEKNAIPADRQCETGIVLCNYGDAGWGKHVAECKYKKKAFDEQLIKATVELIKPFVIENQIKWVTNISSIKRPKLVKDFTMKVAKELGILYQESIIKVVDSRCQKELNTNYLQFKNAYDSFAISNVLSGNVLLIDDMVDSRWTFTVCGYKLRECGSGKVFPFALANTVGRNGDE